MKAMDSAERAREWALREGVQAFIDGESAWANPYEPFTPEWAAWRRGFINATNTSIDFGVGA